MDIQKLISFFMWCTIINLSLLVLGIVGFISVPDLMYNIQGKLFGITRQALTLIMYLFFGGYKIFWLVFNFVPLMTLLIIRKKYQLN